MIIMLYRFIRRRYQNSKTVTADGTPMVKEEKAPRETTSSEWWFRVKLALALAIPIFLETLDYTVVATAQTEIASAFHRLDLQSYIGTLYLLTSTVFLPLFASVADIYGRHFAIQTSLIFFIIGSALSTGAQNMEMMLSGRAIAGIGAAGLLTVVRVIISDSRSLDDNNWQVSILFLLYAIGYSVGPLIGGYLTRVSFRWVFAINLPAAALSMILIFLLLKNDLKKGFVIEGTKLPTSQPRTPSYLSKLTKIDWIGTFLFVSAGILILLALNWGSTQDWDTIKVIVSFTVGGVVLLLCIAWLYALEKKQNNIASSPSGIFSAYPTIPLELFRSIDICTVMAASFAGGMVMIVMFYFVAIFMTVAVGLDPSKAGVQLVYFAPGSGAGTMLAVRMTKRLRQPKYAIQLGGLILPISLGLISMAIQKNNQNMVNGFLAMAGVGCGLTLGSLNVHARFSQPSDRVAIVSALILFVRFLFPLPHLTHPTDKNANTQFRSLGGTVGLAQCGAFLNARVKSHLSSSNINLDFSVSGLGAIASLPASTQTIVRDAFRDGVRWCFISLVPWAGVAFILTVFFLSDIPDCGDKEVEDSVKGSGEKSSSREELNRG
ncbi:hypothetical protein VNI00_018016 [Paramarasmius palmivorus]|uniref:Major facilitator superfamily (MFS) profile domain-containing protein n=1 Tax=Paramarasmius palmivorus TaxID=297713 RepID=A0AAW0B237_9AGAR